MVQVNKLRAKLVERGLTVEEVAGRLGVNRSTLYRKMKDRSGNSFTVRDVQKLSNILNLTAAEIDDIFFGGDVA